MANIRDKNVAMMKALEQSAQLIGSFYKLLQREGLDSDTAGACTVELAERLMDDLDDMVEAYLEVPPKRGQAISPDIPT